MPRCNMHPNQHFFFVKQIMIFHLQLGKKLWQIVYEATWNVTYFKGNTDLNETPEICFQTQKMYQIYLGPALNKDVCCFTTKQTFPLTSVCWVPVLGSKLKSLHWSRQYITVLSVRFILPLEKFSSLHFSSTSRSPSWNLHHSATPMPPLKYPVYASLTLVSAGKKQCICCTETLVMSIVNNNHCTHPFLKNMIIIYIITRSLL